MFRSCSFLHMILAYFYIHHLSSSALLFLANGEWQLILKFDYLKYVFTIIIIFDKIFTLYVIKEWFEFRWKCEEKCIIWIAMDFPARFRLQDWSGPVLCIIYLGRTLDLGRCYIDVHWHYLHAFLDSLSISSQYRFNCDSQRLAFLFIFLCLHRLELSAIACISTAY